MKKKLASQLRNTKTSTQKMKKMFLNFVILSFLLGVAFSKYTPYRSFHNMIHAIVCMLIHEYIIRIYINNY